jgi:hypothetical protein
VGVPQPYEGEGGEEEEDEEETPDVALEVWDLIGQEALLGEPYAVNVVATGKVGLSSVLQIVLGPNDRGFAQLILVAWSF